MSPIASSSVFYEPLWTEPIQVDEPIEAVYGRAIKLQRIRFLIADDPGADKTIMSGLIIKELKLHHPATHILMVAPNTPRTSGGVN